MNHFAAINFPFLTMRMLVACAYLSLAGVFCTVSDYSEETSFRMMRSGNVTDTVSPFGELRMAFTEQLEKNANLKLSFSPAFLDYYVALNQSRDSALIGLSAPFEGNTRYVLRLASLLRSSAGSILGEGKDSLVFFTFRAEQEPNDSSGTADSLHDGIHGTLAMVNDTDWFVCTDTTSHLFALRSFGTVVRLSIYDAGGIAFVGSSATDRDTVAIPADAKYPLFLKISVLNRQSGGYYEIRSLSSSSKNQ